MHPENFQPVNKQEGLPADSSSRTERVYANGEYEPNDQRNFEVTNPAPEEKIVGDGVTITTSLPAPVVKDDDVVAPTTQTNNNPSLANDKDVIEREWVNKARQIVEQTKDNPYRQEEEVNKLQADYLSKRFGRNIGTP